MDQPARYDIGADRWVACIRTFAFLTFDFTGAAYVAQVRLTPDTPGTPLVNLGMAGSAADEGVRAIFIGTDTITNHIAAGRLVAVPPGYLASDNLMLTQVGLRIHEATMEALPFPAERGDDAVFAWDMHITPLGGIKDKYIGGTFTVRAGVTQ